MEILAEAVKFFVGKKQILKGVDLHLYPKEFLGIIGPNGSGKSTFLKCVYRVQKPTEGKLVFDGKLLDEMSYRESALKLAVVAQHNFYNFDFTVLDVVLMGRSPHKKMMERDNLKDYTLARDAIKLVGLEGFEERNFSTLSGGEQQRVILARALTQETECLVLDEPTNHLDIRYQLEIMDIVKSSLSQGENVYLRGFGSFVIKKRAQKTARNISKNTTIIIPEHNIPSFKPAKTFLNEVK